MIMNYTKPTLISLGNAVECVQSALLKHCGPTDSSTEFKATLPRTKLTSNLPAGRSITAGALPFYCKAKSSFHVPSVRNPARPRKHGHFLADPFEAGESSGRSSRSLSQRSNHCRFRL